MKDDKEQSKSDEPNIGGNPDNTEQDITPNGGRDEDRVGWGEGSRGWAVPPGTVEANDEGGLGNPPIGGEDEGSRGW